MLRAASQDAVMMPCCAGSACDECGRNGILESEGNKVGQHLKIIKHFIEISVAPKYDDIFAVPGVQRGRQPGGADSIPPLS